MSNLNELPIHPAAALLPLLSEEYLEALAEDIRLTGQRDEIVVWIDRDGHRCLLDGRNRLAACKLAGIPPHVVEKTYEEITDPESFVLSRNLNRRNLSKSQRAMVIALVRPETRRGPSGESAQFASYLGISSELLRQARYIVRHSRDMAYKVRDGKLSVDDTYRQVKSATSGTGKPEPKERSSNKRSLTPEQARISREVRRAHRQGAEAASCFQSNSIDVTEDDAESEWTNVIEACQVIASIEDPYEMVQMHGDPMSWPSFCEARRMLDDLEDSYDPSCHEPDGTAVTAANEIEEGHAMRST